MPALRLAAIRFAASLSADDPTRRGLLALLKGATLSTSQFARYMGNKLKFRGLDIATRGNTVTVTAPNGDQKRVRVFVEEFLEVDFEQTPGGVTRGFTPQWRTKDWSTYITVARVPGGYSYTVGPGLQRTAGNRDWAKLFPRNSYLNKFFAEKDIRSKVFDVTDSRGVTHSIPNGSVVEAIAQTGSSERRKIEDTIRQLDFRNADINHFFEHLAKGLAEQYAGVMRFASNLDSYVVKTAASEINIRELPPDRTRIVKMTGLRPDVAWKGIHGYIVSFSPQMGNSTRLSADTMKKIVSQPEVRWVEAGRGAFSIGM